MQRPKAAPHVAKCSDDEVGPFLQDGISMENKNGLLFWILGISGDDRNVPSYWESLLDV